MTPGLPHLVWMAPTSWDGIPGTDRPLAMALTRYARVLWVDPPVSPVTPARLRGEVSGGLLPTVTDIDEGLTRLTPVALPGLTRPGSARPPPRLSGPRSGGRCGGAASSLSPWSPVTLRICSAAGAMR